MTSTLLVTPAAKRSCDCSTRLLRKLEADGGDLNLLRSGFQVEQRILHILLDARLQVVDLRLPLLQNGVGLLHVSFHLAALKDRNAQVCQRPSIADASTLGVYPSTP